MLRQVSTPVHDALVHILRRSRARVRLSLNEGALGPYDFVGRIEGDAGGLLGWRVHAVVHGSPPDDEGVEIMLGLERFDHAHVEDDVAVFVAGTNRLEIAPVLS